MKFSIGIVLILLICVIWSIASVIVQDAEGKGVDAFFITYVCNAMFILLLCCRNKRKKTSKAKAGLISPVWMIAQGSYNLSLELTSISSSTILSTTSSLWALFFGLFLFKSESADKRVRLRIIGSLLSIFGAACVVLADDSKDTKNSSLGDLCALVSAALYGFYGAALGLYTRNEDGQDITIEFLGTMGIWNLSLFALPLALYFYFFHYEASLARATGFIFQTDKVPPIVWVFLKGIFDNLLSDFLYAKAVLFTTPTVATLGLSLTIPLAVLTDLFLLHRSVLPLQIFGAFAVVFGFLLTVYASTTNQPPESSTAYLALPPESSNDQNEDDPWDITSSSTTNENLIHDNNDANRNNKTASIPASTRDDNFIDWTREP